MYPEDQKGSLLLCSTTDVPISLLPIVSMLGLTPTTPTRHSGTPALRDWGKRWAAAIFYLAISKASLQLYLGPSSQTL